MTEDNQDFNIYEDIVAETIKNPQINILKNIDEATVKNPALGRGQCLNWNVAQDPRLNREQFQIQTKYNNIKTYSKLYNKSSAFQCAQNIKRKIIHPSPSKNRTNIIQPSPTKNSTKKIRSSPFKSRTKTPTPVLFKCLKENAEENIFNVLANRGMLESKVWKTQMALYDEIIEAEVAERENKKKQNLNCEELLQELTNLKHASLKKEEKISELNVKVTNLTKNICSLYKTARSEITRKDSLLAEANCKVDTLELQLKVGEKRSDRPTDNHNEKFPGSTNENHKGNYSRESDDTYRRDRNGSLEKRYHSSRKLSPGERDHNSRKASPDERDRTKRKGLPDNRNDSKRNESHEERNHRTIKRSSKERDLSRRKNSPEDKDHHSRRKRSPEVKDHHSRRKRSPEGSDYHSRRKRSPEDRDYRSKRKRSPDDKNEHNKRNSYYKKKDVGSSSNTREDDIKDKHKHPETSISFSTSLKNEVRERRNKRMFPSSNFDISKKLELNEPNLKRNSASKEVDNKTVSSEIEKNHQNHAEKSPLKEKTTCEVGTKNKDNKTLNDDNKTVYDKDIYNLPTPENIDTKKSNEDNKTVYNKDLHNHLTSKNDMTRTKLSQKESLLNESLNLSSNKMSCGNGHSTINNGLPELDQIEEQNSSDKDYSSHEDNVFELFEDSTTTNAVFFLLLPIELRQAFMKFETNLIFVMNNLKNSPANKFKQSLTDYETACIVVLNRLKQSFINYFFSHYDDAEVKTCASPSAETLENDDPTIQKKKDTDSSLFFFEGGSHLSNYNDLMVDPLVVEDAIENSQVIGDQITSKIKTINNSDSEGLKTNAPSTTTKPDNLITESKKDTNCGMSEVPNKNDNTIFRENTCMERKSSEKEEIDYKSANEISKTVGVNVKTVIKEADCSNKTDLLVSNQNIEKYNSLESEKTIKNSEVLLALINNQVDDNSKDEDSNSDSTKEIPVSYRKMFLGDENNINDVNLTNDENSDCLSSKHSKNPNTTNSSINKKEYNQNEDNDIQKKQKDFKNHECKDNDSNSDSTSEIPVSYRKVFLEHENNSNDVTNSENSDYLSSKQFTNNNITNSSNMNKECNKEEKVDNQKKQNNDLNSKDQNYDPKFSSVFYRRQLLKVAIEEIAKDELSAHIKEDVSKLYNYRNDKISSYFENKQ